MGRSKGAGALYFVKQQNLWRAVLDIPGGPKRKQWSATSRDRAVAEAKLRAKMIELGRDPDAPPEPTPITRWARMLAAREQGERHTAAEVRALMRNMPSTCRYCGVRLDTGNCVRDHIVPIAKGGSDAITNLQLICWECNLSKSASEDYEYDGEAPRTYRPRRGGFDPRAPLDPNAPALVGWGRRYN